MDVSIKGLEVNMQLKNKGIELAVYDGKEHLGDLFINRANIIWCPGKSTPKSGGKSISWREFIKVWEK
jgi:hypothetical protein